MTNKAPFYFDMPEKLRNDLLRLETDCRRFGFPDIHANVDGGVLSVYMRDKHGIHKLVHHGRHFFELREVD